MTDKRDEKLDLLLRSRAVKPASADLVQRIVLRAQQLPQKNGFSLWQWIRELCVEFHLPKPGYVLASALVIGLMIGYSAPQDIDPSSNDVVAAQNMLSADEALL